MGFSKKENVNQIFVKMKAESFKSKMFNKNVNWETLIEVMQNCNEIY